MEKSKVNSNSPSLQIYGRINFGNYIHPYSKL